MHIMFKVMQWGGAGIVVALAAFGLWMLIALWRAA